MCVAAADSIVPLLFHLHVKENALLNCFVGERVCVSLRWIGVWILFSL